MEGVYQVQQFQFVSRKRMLYSNYSFSMPKPYQSIQMPKTFPQDIQCIIKGSNAHSGSLYISNVEAASNPDTLKRLKITAVLSCAKGYELKHPRSVVPHYKYIPTVDHDECDISMHFEEAVGFIAQKLKYTQVLVHCIAGVSRSVSMVLAYFIKHHGMHYEEAYRLVKSKRKIIHPNDGFIRQLKQYSQRVKSEQKMSRKDGLSSGSPNKTTTDISVSYDKIRDNNFLDKTMGNFKSIELSPQKEITPNKNGNTRGTGIYERYSSAQLKTTSPAHQTPSTHNRPPPGEYPPQSLQHIPDCEPFEQSRSNTLTPKTKQDIPTQQRNQLTRTSTNYYTPSKTALMNQKPYQATRRYEEYARTTTKVERPGTSPLGASPLTNPSASPAPAPTEITGATRKEYFASKNSELNEKIEMIRKKYAAERQKLVSKFSPQKESNQTTQTIHSINDPQRRRVSLGEYRAERPTPTRPYLQQTRQTFTRTDSKQQVYNNKMGGFQSYGELHHKRYERVGGNFVLNEEESLTRGEKSLRNNLYDAAQRNTRDYDRLGGFGGVQYGYPAYSPYYKYGASSYKRYY